MNIRIGAHFIAAFEYADTKRRPAFYASGQKGGDNGALAYWVRHGRYGICGGGFGGEVIMNRDVLIESRRGAGV